MTEMSMTVGEYLRKAGTDQDDTARAAINDMLAVLRTYGLIAG